MAKTEKPTQNGDLSQEEEAKLIAEAEALKNQLSMVNKALESTTKSLNKKEKEVEELNNVLTYARQELEKTKEAYAAVCSSVEAIGEDWRQAKLLIAELEAQAGNLNGEEEEAVLKDLEQAKADASNLEAELKKKIDFLNKAEECNKEFKEKIEKLKSDFYNYKLEDAKADAKVKENYEKSIIDVTCKLWDAQAESQAKDFKINDLLKELGILKTPNDTSKVAGAVKALENIDLRNGDFYDEVAGTVIMFNELVRSKDIRDFKELKRIVKKHLRKEMRFVRKLKFSTVQKLN